MSTMFAGRLLKTFQTFIRNNRLTGNMPKGAQLTEFQRGQILAYNEAGLSGRQIAAKVGKSKSCVNNFLANRNSYGTKKRSGLPRSLTPRDRRQVARLATNRKLSSKDIHAQLGLSCTPRTVRNVLAANPSLQYLKSKRKPPLTEKHKRTRLEFARSNVDFGPKWGNVVFSDEKKFNLDGPDGFRYYWHDLRKTPEILSKRRFGGGSLMIWAAFAVNGKTIVVVMRGKQNSSRYLDILGEHLLPVAPLITTGSWVFQQDNASIHVSNEARSWFAVNEVDLIAWPARSPDLNPMENLWGILVRKIYAHGRQFQSVPDLEVAIKEAWDSIDGATLKNLATSMKDRLLAVLMNKGGPTKY